MTGVLQRLGYYFPKKEEVEAFITGRDVFGLATLCPAAQVLYRGNRPDPALCAVAWLCQTS